MIMNFTYDHDDFTAPLDVEYTFHKGTTPGGGPDPDHVEIIHVWAAEIDILPVLDDGFIETLTEIAYEK